MEKLIIRGGWPLCGSITTGGSKNAALPILLAGILADGPVYYRNVPRLRDIFTTHKLLNILGCEASFDGEEGDSARTCVGTLNPEAPYDLVKTMRASVLVLGPLLARLGRAKVALPGGCAIGARPVDQHLKGLERMGARFDLDSGYIVGRCAELRGAEITFDFPTVGGTENLLMAAVLAKGQSILRNAAREPEIADLAHFLGACGARIEGIGSDTLHIQGVETLHGCSYAVMPDRIEAGTFLLAGAITRGELMVENCPVKELDALLVKMEDMGLKIERHEHKALVKSNGTLRGTQATTSPYPGFPTDMQAQILSLMALAQGSSVVEETIFENRFMHVPELCRMGADIRLSGSKATVRGVRQLIGAPVMASDLRAGAALVLAGLAAKGETQVQRIYHLDRGYERMEHKLRNAGAEITRVNDK
ncbi:MAG: UDP-N-acetylglucosamine 1-carboxyvinyltransferase [Deltaproteobacteria bacterium]|jgi:UDP-N-acetylglucosamine 1-carboxyvinyltransferase|nr:UDP-N-acetylglucosamine 1-carboxyvinyltransferase [Deltaproteobacteria bacterium]